MKMTYNYITYDKIYGFVNYGETTLDTDDMTTWWTTKERCKDCGGAWLAENYLDGHYTCPFCGSENLLHIGGVNE